jgi:hypothetical protein
VVINSEVSVNICNEATYLLKMDVSFVLKEVFVFAVLVINSALAIQCYRCTSSQPGCGKELSIRLQKWHTCPDTGEFGGENFCVKVIENIGSDIVITRECLMTLRHSEKHREKLPTVQRQNYCQPGRNNDPHKPYDEKLTFCFCNDWNGCNGATQTKRLPFTMTFVAFSIATLLYIMS